MKAIVTGGAGFIGSHIAERLVKDGHEVIVIDDLSAGKEENIPNGVIVDGGIKFFYKWDITWPLPPIKNVDVIFHNAASKKNICLKDPTRDLEVNGAGTLKLLLWAAAMDVKKFVHASTGSVYGEAGCVITEQTPVNPCSYYGISKLAGESYVRHFNKYLNTTVLRYFHVYGSRQENDPNLGGVVAIFTKLISEGKPITIHGDGKQERVFTHVDDIVEANMKAIDINGGVFNCASSKQTTILELAEGLAKKLGKPLKINYADELEGDIRIFDVYPSLRNVVKFRDYE